MSDASGQADSTAAMGAGDTSTEHSSWGQGAQWVISRLAGPAMLDTLPPSSVWSSSGTERIEGY